MVREFPIMLPDLELPHARLTVVAWLVRVGERVVEGDRLLEINAGEASLEIDSPASGILAEKRVDVDDLLAPGQVLGMIRER